MNRVHDQRIAAGILASSAVISFAALWPTERNALGDLGAAVADGLVALLGGGAVLVPPLLLDGAVLCLWRRERLVRIAGWLLGVTAMCMALHLISDAGGALGRLVGGTLHTAIGIGAHLLCLVVLLAFAARVLGLQRLVAAAHVTDRGARRIASAWHEAGERMAALPRPADLGVIRPPPHVIDVEPEPVRVAASRVPVEPPKRREPPPLPRKAPEVELAAVEPSRPVGAYSEPPTSVFAEGDQDTPLNDTALKGMALALQRELLQRGVAAAVKATVPGPLITRYDVEIARGTAVKAVISLAQDLSVALKLEHVMEIAPVMGTGLIGFSLPNKAALRRTIYLRPLLESDAWQRYTGALPLVVGKTPEGQPVFRDLARMPHLLVAGATGAGKSVGLNVMLCSLLMRRSPAEMRLILIDPKIVELSVYDRIPHMLTPVVTEMDAAAKVLTWAVAEMERRYKRLHESSVRDLDGFNAKNPADRMARIVIVIDELADLLISHKENAAPFTRLAQKARAAGIHMIVATQRPSTDVIEGVIKANLPSRIAYKTASLVDSQVIMDESGAEKLLGFGDSWVKTPESTDKMRVHSAFVSIEEVEALCARLRAGGEAQCDPSIVATEAPEAPGRNLQSEDAVYDRALEALAGMGPTVSTSKLQNALNVGFQKASKLVARMVEEGVLAPYDRKAKCHRVLLEHAEQGEAG